MSRTETRPITRRSFLFAFFGSLLGTLTCLRHTAARLTSIEGTELEYLFRWCSFDRPRFAGAS